MDVIDEIFLTLGICIGVQIFAKIIIIIQLIRTTQKTKKETENELVFDNEVPELW